MQNAYSSIPIEVSARHVHLSEKDFQILFGQASKLSSRNNLSQPGQFAANETLILKNGDKQIENVRVIGPFRNETQVELAVSDCRRLGIQPHFSLSGDLSNSPGITLVGPNESVKLDSGVIVPLTHIHMDVSEAKKFGLSHLDKVSIKIDGARSLTLHNIVIRARQNIDHLALHLDTDQANTIGNVENAKIVLIQKESD